MSDSDSQEESEDMEELEMPVDQRPTTGGKKLAAPPRAAADADDDDDDDSDGSDAGGSNGAASTKRNGGRGADVKNEKNPYMEDGGSKQKKSKGSSDDSEEDDDDDGDSDFGTKRKAAAPAKAKAAPPAKRKMKSSSESSEEEEESEEDSDEDFGAQKKPTARKGAGGGRGGQGRGASLLDKRRAAQALKGGKGGRRGGARKKVLDSESEESDGDFESDESEEAPPEPRPRPSRKRKAGSDSDDPSDDDWGGGGRSSKGPTRKSSRKQAAATYNEDKDDSDLLESDEKEMYHYQEEFGAQEQGNKATIEKIMGKELRDDEWRYLIKWKDKSYLHCSWESDVSVLAEGGKRRLDNFSNKWPEIKMEVDERGGEYFDSAFTEVERIVAAREMRRDEEDEEDEDEEDRGDGFEYLCKWRNLPYAECTWETKPDVIESIGTQEAEEKIEAFRRFQEPPGDLLPLSRTQPEVEIAKQEREKRRRQRRPPVPDSTAGADGEIKEDFASEIHFKNNNKLRAYQKEGVNWLVFNWLQRRGSILADEMGLGKTVQAVGFINYLFSVQKRRGPFLVVAPLSTIPHWQREAEAWTDLNAIVFHGNQESRDAIVENEFYHTENGQRITNCYKFNLIITTWEVVMADGEKDGGTLADVMWDSVVVDEAHRLKNKDSKTFRSLKNFKAIPPCDNPEGEAHCVLMTGTPLQNNTAELWCLLHFLAPGVFGDLEKFLLKYGALEDAQQVMSLRSELKPFMLRRHKEDVEKSIPPKEEIIVEVEMSQLQRTTYKSILEKNFDWLKRGAAGAQVPALRNVEMELRKCCNHPYLIDGVEDQVKNHMSGGADLVQQLVFHSGKMVLLDKILPKLKSEDHRVLIFSQFIRVLDMLEGYMRAKGYPSERIDGRIRGNLRQAAIDRYNEKGPHRFAFLICTKAGGMGINLTTADTVIIFDSDWNPQNDLQAQARCHRIGQTREVKIYRFITSKTYERQMFERASKKQGLEQAVIAGKNTEKNKNAKQVKKDLERLLRHGAYDIFNEDAEEESSRFNEEDIDSILSRRSTKVVATEEDAQAKMNNSFSTASFVPASASQPDIDYNDPNFWEKLMPQAPNKKPEQPPMEELRERNRKTVERLGFDKADMSDADSDSGSEDGGRRRPHGWTKDDMKKTKRQLLAFGFGRWVEIHAAAQLRQPTVGDVQTFCKTFVQKCAQMAEIKAEQLQALVQATSAAHVEHPSSPGSLPIDERAMLKACNLKDKTAADSFKRLSQLAALQRAISHGGPELQKDFVAQRPTLHWGSKQDRDLLRAVDKHGMEEAGKELDEGGTLHQALIEAASEHPDNSAEGQAAIREELEKKLSRRALECLKRLEAGAASGNGVAEKRGKGDRRSGGKAGGARGQKRQKADSDGSGYEDFQDAKKKGKKAKDGKGKPSAQPPASPRGGSPHLQHHTERIQFTVVQITEKLKLEYPGHHSQEEAFRTPRYKYPVGYTCVYTWKKQAWRCEILEAKSRPLFRVMLDDGSSRAYKSDISPSHVWRQVAMEHYKMKPEDALSIDGIAHFGLDIKEVRHHVKDATKEWRRLQEAGAEGAAVVKKEESGSGRKSPVIGSPPHAKAAKRGLGGGGLGRRR